MPVVFRYKGYSFFFYSREPIHVHVRSHKGEAKIWLSPVSVAESDGFDAKTLRELLSIAADNSVLIERTWHEHFG